MGGGVTRAQAGLYVDAKEREIVPYTPRRHLATGHMLGLSPKWNLI